MEQADKVCQSADDMFGRGNFQELRDAMSNVCLKEDNSGLKYGMKSNYLFLLASSARIIRTNYLMQPGKEHAATETTSFTSTVHDK